MSTKSILFAVALGLLGVAGGWYAARHGTAPAESPSVAAAPATKANHVYHCPMHPWIKSDQPGKCTICGMDLVLVGETAEDAPDVIALGASTVTVLGVKTEPVARRPLERHLHVAGMIDDSDSSHRFLTAPAAGRIEQLHVNFVGAEVKAGEPLATLYSPELLNAQREFLQLVHGGEVAGPAIAPARERLIGLGLSAQQIDAMIARGEPEPRTTLLAPASGTIVARGAYPGQNVNTGDRLFEIGDFSTMWFQFEAYEQDMSWLKVGQKVEVTARAVPGRVFSAEIAFIDPNFDENAHSTHVRVELPNPFVGEGAAVRRIIPHRVFGEGVVQVASPAVLAVPRSAVLNAGLGAVVYVDLGAGRYQFRRVQIGRVGDRYAEVTSGLNENERVVTEGNLLIDAQTQLSHEAEMAEAAPMHHDAEHSAP